MSIGIIGLGYVGKYVWHFFSLVNNEIYVYDTNMHGLVKDMNEVKAKTADIIFICVPTPMAEDGSCDTSIVEQVINECSDKSLICIKSTVSVGFTEAMKESTGKRIVFSPEYAGESTYFTPYDFHKDMVKSDYFIFGGDKKDCSELIDLYMPIAGPTKKYIITDSKSAEMCKYVENSFFALKVIFCNQIKDACEVLGLDYNEVRELWLFDSRINPMHTMVTEKRGYGGKCFPKDVIALIRTINKNGGALPLLELVNYLNKTMYGR